MKPDKGVVIMCMNSQTLTWIPSYWPLCMYLILYGVRISDVHFNFSLPWWCSRKQPCQPASRTVTPFFSLLSPKHY